MILPGSKSSKGLRFAGGTGTTIPANRLDYIRLICTQEGIYLQFQRQRGRQAGQLTGTQLLNVGLALLDVLIVRLHRQGEFQVGKRVFVSAEDPCCSRQAPEQTQGVEHLFRGTFEQPATAGGKQGVATEQYRTGAVVGAVIGNVPEGVA